MKRLKHNDKLVILGPGEQRFTGLCFTATEENSTISLDHYAPEKYQPVVWNGYYSFDGENWNAYTIGDEPIILENIGDKVYFKGKYTFTPNNSVYMYFVMTGKIHASGNIMSMCDEENFITLTSIKSEYQFNKLFLNCTSLITPPELPATTLKGRSYMRMFSGCSNLICAPSLPALSVPSGAYLRMFSNCSSLIYGPELPATTIEEWAYSSMFYECSSLKKGPSELPFVEADQQQCYQMFYGCSSLQIPPELPATKVGYWAYELMFYGCTNLQYAPALPATELGEGCYYGMFQGCKRLTKAPTLPALTLYKKCYAEMFADCVSLVEAPELPALETSDRMDSECYTSMFSGCTSLVKPPSLPMKNDLPMYRDMFSGCVSLQYVPEINSSYIYNNAFYKMFYQCTSLYVSETQTKETPHVWKIPLEEATGGNLWPQDYMFTGCLGTRSTDSPDWAHTNQRIYYTKYLPIPLFSGLCFTANTAGSTISLNKIGSPNWTGSYSINGANWNEYIPGTTGILTLTNAGDKIYFKGDIGANFNISHYLQFSMTGSIAASGNCNSMYVSSGFNSLNALTYEYCYCYMFKNCTSLTTAPILPSTTLSRSCYRYMFSGCTSLISPPSLPATILTRECYDGMFNGCTSLITPPELPATTLDEDCYMSMFGGCTSLNVAPALPATTLANYCYLGMFSGCTSLTTAPELPATTLTDWCYQDMFRGCTALTTPPQLPATILSINNPCIEMFMGCSSLQVSDTQTTEAPHVWRIPSINVFASGSTQKRMFYGCAGSRSSDDMPGGAGNKYIYYTQNKPVGPSVNKLYLYNGENGSPSANRCITDTGDYHIVYGWDYLGSEGYLDEQNFYMDFGDDNDQYRGITIQTNNLIDISNYSKLCIDGYVVSHSTGSYGYGYGAGLSSNLIDSLHNDYGTPEGGGMSRLTNETRTITELDISSITGSYHIHWNCQCEAWNVHTTISRVYAVWLE